MTMYRVTKKTGAVQVLEDNKRWRTIPSPLEEILPPEEKAFGTRTLGEDSRYQYLLTNEP